MRNLIQSSLLQMTKAHGGLHSPWRTLGPVWQHSPATRHRHTRTGPHTLHPQHSWKHRKGRPGERTWGYPSEMAQSVVLTFCGCSLGCGRSWEIQSYAAKKQKPAGLRGILRPETRTGVWVSWGRGLKRTPMLTDLSQEEFAKLLSHL